MDDSEIIKLFWSRDEAAIEQTECKYGNRLRSQALRVLNSSEDAEECVSDTLLKTWDTIPPQKPVHFFAYISKICRTVSFGMLDWKNAQKRKAEIVVLTEEMEQCIPDLRSGVDHNMEEKELAHLLNAFLAGLPQDKRRIFVRRYWFMDPIHSIAKKYGISVSKVKTTLFRMRNDLKDFLEKEGVAV